jgi:hypothetical protein
MPSKGLVCSSMRLRDLPVWASTQSAVALMAPINFSRKQYRRDASGGGWSKSIFSTSVLISRLGIEEF